MKNQKNKERIETVHGVMGECPVCGGYELNYGPAKDCNGGFFYRWYCRDCGSEGEEVYTAEFSHHNITHRGIDGFTEAVKHTMEFIESEKFQEIRRAFEE